MSVSIKQNGELTKIAGLYQSTTPINMADCYSTEEKIVGCWTDGKPLYQKTIITPFSDKAKGSRSRVDILDGNQGIEPKIILGTMTVDEYATFNMNGVGHDFADASTSNYAYATYTYTLAGAVSVVLRQYFYDGAASGYFTTTVKYTKSTDTPGSGQWTPSGAPAVHYSSQEHIIGTYEGETLYERTITHEGQLSSGFNSFLTVNDIKAMIGCELSVRNSSNNSWHNCSSSSSSSSMEVQIQIDANNVGSFGVITSTTWNNPVVIATYRYTKTTD